MAHAHSFHCENVEYGNFTASAVVSYSGARLCLSNLNVFLTIPEGALPRGHRQEVILSVLQEDKHRPRLSGELNRFSNPNKLVLISIDRKTIFTLEKIFFLQKIGVKRFKQLHTFPGICTNLIVTKSFRNSKIVVFSSSDLLKFQDSLHMTL